MTWLPLLDYASVLVFAITGALVASRAQLDLIGFVFVAALTAVGGGTVRDLLLDRNPVFWIAEPTNIAVAGIAALITFFTAHLFESRLKVVIWLDALALAIAVSAGVATAQALGQTPTITILMGVITGCMGGLLRDVVCNEVPLVLKQGELYVTAALAGAAAATMALHITTVTWVPLVACTALTFTLRAGSIAFGWHIPVYKPRPPRS
ncbi:trimeric intracellular cation channel family protein [Shimia ponticola]|uniref:trimeric intracellular cation channel family protein n=1 Tax=Shimia ponticola TaxID=2582893 RepID=UPI0011BDD739|nr:trimeric intracellular cation channel family protein [Shimia ponticola]